MSPFLARVLANTPVQVTAQGAAIGSALALVNNTGIAYVVGTNGGGGLKLPSIGGDTGVLLGDDIIVFNVTGDAMTVYASNSATITGYGASASGNTGVTVATCNGAAFWPVTATSWVYNRFGSA